MALRLRISAATEEEDDTAAMSSKGGSCMMITTPEEQCCGSISLCVPDGDGSGDVGMDVAASAESGRGGARGPFHLRTVSIDSEAEPAPGSGASLVFDSKKAKMDYFSKDCTPITDYLFVGGKKVAASEEKLLEKGITHIINCAGDVCENYFPDRFHYLKLHLLDSAAEDIMCVLYKVIDYIDVVRKGKQRVLVHCQQGVSRSTVLAIAYLMYLENRDYDAIYEFVRSRRGICRPNVGFMCQLLAWRKRVTRGSNRPYCMYRIGPHNARDPSLVTKWVDRVEAESLDSRTLFMLQTMGPHNSSDGDSGSSSTGNSTAGDAAASPSVETPGGVPAPGSVIYIWVGMLCPRETERTYIPYLAHLIAKIQQVEHAGRTVLLIRQKGRERIEKATEAAAKAGSSPMKRALLAAGSNSPTPSSPNTLALPTSPGAVGGASNGSSASLPSSSAPGASSAPLSPASSLAFSSEHISAAFHMLESAPAILSASSLSNLYPTATPKQAAHFYRIMGLEESDDYARVGADRSHPISGAILINEQLDQDYPEVPVPDVEALNEFALKHGVFGPAKPATPQQQPQQSGVHRTWVVPPIVRVGQEEAGGEDEDECGDRDGVPPAPMDAADTESGGGIEAYARNLSANISATPLGSGGGGDGGSSGGSGIKLSLPRHFTNHTASSVDDGGSASGTHSPLQPQLSLPPRRLNLFVGSSSPDVEPIATPSGVFSPPRLVLPSASSSPVISARGIDSANNSSRSNSSRSQQGISKPRLLNLKGISHEDDDEVMPAGDGSSGGGEGGLVPIPVTAVSPVAAAAAAPTAPSSSSSTSSHPPPHPSPFLSPSSAVALSSGAGLAGRAALSSPASQPVVLYEFPSFTVLPRSRSSLRAPGIFVLHDRLSGQLWVWMGPPGQLFMPSKYEGDRELFAGDIAKSFQLTAPLGPGADNITNVGLEQAGKETKEFLDKLEQQ